MSKEPKFKIIQSHQQIEIREYETFVVADVEVAGERREALREGFRILAEFIFGGNEAKTKITMQIPVTQQQENDYWKISFMMPEEYSSDTLPQPNNPQIKITLISQQRAVVITFSGTPSDENIDRHLKKLEAYCKEREIQTVGMPIFAFYNPPWTLPILRRNEVMYRI